MSVAGAGRNVLYIWPSSAELRAQFNSVVIEWEELSGNQKKRRRWEIYWLSYIYFFFYSLFISIIVLMRWFRCCGGFVGFLWFYFPSDIRFDALRNEQSEVFVFFFKILRETFNFLSCRLGGNRCEGWRSQRRGFLLEINAQHPVFFFK